MGIGLRRGRALGHDLTRVWMGREGKTNMKVGGMGEYDTTKGYWGFEYGIGWG